MPHTQYGRICFWGEKCTERIHRNTRKEMNNNNDKNSKPTKQHHHRHTQPTTTNTEQKNVPAWWKFQKCDALSLIQSIALVLQYQS